mgnify:CR=1 FL=1
MKYFLILELWKTKCQSTTIPSGIFREDTMNLVGNGVVIDPVVFQKEIESLGFNNHITSNGQEVFYDGEEIYKSCFKKDEINEVISIMDKLECGWAYETRSNIFVPNRNFSINYFSLFARVSLLFLFYILIVFCFKTICFYYLHINVFNYISLLIIFLLIGFQLFIFVRYFIKQCDSFYPIKADSRINSFCSVSFLKGHNLFTSSLIFINDDLIFYSERGSIPNLLILKI